MSTTQAGAGPVSDGTKTPGQIARDAFYDGRTDLLWDELAPASVDDWERAGAAVAALAPPAVVPEEVRRLRDVYHEAVIKSARTGLEPRKAKYAYYEACAGWIEALISTPSRRTDTPPAGGGAVTPTQREIDLEEQLREAVAFLEVDPEASQPGTDIYTWLKLTEQFFTEETDDTIDARIARTGARENMRLIDSISDLIGLPHNVELELYHVRDALAAAPAAPEPAAGGGRETPSNGTAAHHAHSLEIAAKVLRGLAKLASADSCDKAAAFLRSLSAPSEAQDAGESWQLTSTAPPNLAIQVYVPSLDYYGNQGVYAGMLVDMGTGRRWMTFAWAMGCDMFGENVPTHWRPLPPPPTNRADTGAEGGQ